MTIKTITKAAAELFRLYAVLDRKAVDLTPAYIKKRLAGKEGVTWNLFPRTGVLSKPTPILDSVVRHEGTILLNAGYDRWQQLSSSYELAKVSAKSLGVSAASAKDAAITIHRLEVGFDPGEKYLILGDQVLKAGYDHLPSVPSPHRDGLDWSSPRDVLNDTYGAMTEVDDGLLRVLKDMKKYA